MYNAYAPSLYPEVPPPQQAPSQGPPPGPQLFMPVPTQTGLPGDAIFMTQPPYGYAPSPQSPPMTEKPLQPSAMAQPAAAVALPVSPPMAVAPPEFGPVPMRIVCRHCRTRIETRLDHCRNVRTHLVALVLCVTGAWCCVPLPYFLNTCKSTDHYCPICEEFLGRCKM